METKKTGVKGQYEHYTRFTQLPGMHPTVGSSLDLLIESFQRLRRVDPQPVTLWEVHVRQDVSLWRDQHTSGLRVASQSRFAERLVKSRLWLVQVSVMRNGPCWGLPCANLSISAAFAAIENGEQVEGKQVMILQAIYTSH